MTENLPVIEIHDLHKSYDRLDVLKGVDLVAHEGNVVTPVSYTHLTLPTTERV